ncbi:MAG: redoxin domain-containing protein [Gemmatimonadetes bacterium]|nr:redoxin domain-containing protein [Gemmatimonadota bacterium]
MVAVAVAPHFPQPGEAAPDFTLPSTAGEMVTLSSFRGRQHVLLAFFPLAFTSVCTAELCSFSDDFDAFSGRDVVVFPVSVDAIPSLKVFRSMHQMTVHLLSDFKREVVGPWDLLVADKFFSRRAYVLIDKAGVVRWSFVEANDRHKRENAELLQQIAALG